MYVMVCVAAMIYLGNCTSGILCFGEYSFVGKIVNSLRYAILGYPILMFPFIIFCVIFALYTNVSNKKYRKDNDD